MDNNTSAGIKDYDDILQQMSALLNLSISEITDKHAAYPYRQINYLEKRRSIENLIEIRYDKEEMTVNCLFNTGEKCSCVYLFPDKSETIAGFIFYLKETFDYDYIRNRWKVSGYYVKVVKIGKSSDNLCLMIYLA